MKVLDLTMSLSPEIKVFPGSPQPFFIPWSTLDMQGYDSEVMTMSTHTGTHMDAPSHFFKGKKAIGDIPASRLVCNAVLIRVPKKAGQTIGVSDIEGNDINPGDAVIFATGWERRHKSKDYMTANPGLSKAAARYLVRKKVNLAGIDGPSIDPGRDSKFSAHKILLPAGVLAVENLRNLGKIKKKRFTLVVAPLKLEGATGSPARALALF
jgi:kynurenine formamidase